MSKIILQNIDNIDEYYVPIFNKKNNIYIDSGILNEGKSFEKYIISNDNNDDNDDNDDNNEKLDKLNNYLKKYKFINTNDKLYTFYDINNNIIKCIIADYKKEGDNNSIYIIQIKDDFFNNNNKLFKKKNKFEVKNELINSIYKNTDLNKLL